MTALWARLPFIARLLVTASMALLVAGAAMVFGSARHEATEIQQDLAVELEKELETLPAALAEIVVVGDFSTLQQTLDRYVSRPLIASVKFIDTTTVGIGSVKERRATQTPQWFLEFFDFHAVTGQAPVLVGGRNYGELKLTLSADERAERAWRHLLHYLAILVLAIVIDFLGIWLVLRAGLAPLRRLEAGVDALASGQHEVRLEVVGGPEFRRLIDAFNRMVAAMSSGRAALQEEIAHRKENEARIIEMREAAEAANLAKSQFLATMSHEIRTPMNGILGMAQLLQGEQISDDERREFARTILESGQTLLNLLNDILDLSKVEAGKLELDIGVVKPVQLLDDTRRLFVELAREKNLQLAVVTTLPADAAYRGDPLRLRQMMANLTGNALKFTARGAVTLEVREHENEPGHRMLEFSVLDTGIGISPEKQGQLFRPFSQADSSTTREYGGSGLGLSIVRSLALLMRGDAGVESTAGKGSRFWFRIPAQPVKQVGQNGAPVTRTEGQTSVPVRFGGRVLVVEDNPTNRRVVGSILERLGLMVDYAEDGCEGVAKVQAGPRPDLVIMDIQMPKLDGRTATGQIRAWETAQGDTGGGRMPIIALTADAFDSDRERCFQAGMDDYLTKPVQVGALRGVLARWLPVRPLVQEAPAVQGAHNDVPAVFDESLMLASLMGDRSIARMLIESALGDMPQLLREIRQNVEQRCWSDAQHGSHTLKGLALQVGGCRLHAAVKGINDALKRSEPVELATIARLEASYAELEKTLWQWLQQK